MTERCKRNPCCGDYLNCTPPPQFTPREKWDDYKTRTSALAKPASEPAGGGVREALARAREIAGLLTERAIKLSVNGRVPNADADLMRRAGAWMRGMADIFEASLSAPATPSPAEEVRS